MSTDIKVHYSAPPTVTPFNRNLQNISRKLEFGISEGTGETKMIVKDDSGEVIRYLPPVTVSEKVKLDMEKITNKKVNYFI